MPFARRCPQAATPAFRCGWLSLGLSSRIGVLAHPPHGAAQKGCVLCAVMMRPPLSCGHFCKGAFSRSKQKGENAAPAGGSIYPKGEYLGNELGFQPAAHFLVNTGMRVAALVVHRPGGQHGNISLIVFQHRMDGFHIAARCFLYHLSLIHI